MLDYERVVIDIADYILDCFYDSGDEWLEHRFLKTKKYSDVIKMIPKIAEHVLYLIENRYGNKYFDIKEWEDNEDWIIDHAIEETVE